jgi:hypothetical protein
MVVNGRYLIGFFEPNFGHTQTTGQVLKFTVVRPGTAGTADVMVGQQELQVYFSNLAHLGGISFDDHTCFGCNGASGLNAHALNVANAQAACSISAEVRVITKCWQLNVSLSNHLQQVFFSFNGNHHPINIYNSLCFHLLYFFRIVVGFGLTTVSVFIFFIFL